MSRILDTVWYIVLGFLTLAALLLFVGIMIVAVHGIYDHPLGFLIFLLVLLICFGVGMFVDLLDGV